MAEEPTIKDLDPRLQKQIQNAEQSIARGNPNYAIDVCSGILENQPGCVDVRKILRKAQKAMAASSGKGSRMFSGVTNAPFMMKATQQVKKDPLAAIQTAEKMLKANPANVQALKLLGSAAEAAELVNTAVLAYEGIKEVDSKNQENLLMLGEALFAAERVKECIKVCEELLTVAPGHGGASDLVRRASVSKSIDEGSWDKEDGDFRDKLKDESEAVKLEQAARVVNDEETLNKLIHEVYALIQEQPDNINHYKTIADYYRKLEDHQSAMDWIAHARAQPTGAADVTLEALQSELYVESMEKTIKGYADYLVYEPDNEQYQQEMQAYQQQLDEYKLEQAKTLVEKYPNDYNYRFELGILLFESGDHDSALKEFQLSQRNPKVRVRSLLYLGRALKAGGKFDLAAEQFKTLRDELQLMDDNKKSTIYELADAYEQMGREEEAMEEYKTLYQVDIGYRDVADKINAFYERKNAG